MPYIFGEFSANLPAQVKSLIVTAWNTQVTHFPTEMQIFRNPRMLVLLFESTYNFDKVKVSPVLDAFPVLQSLQILGSGMMAKDNSNELASPVTSVKNDSMAEDNIDELVSPVTSVKNDSMDEDNIDELVSPVNSMKNKSAGSKPDKISTIKPRSMCIRNKLLPCYHSSSSTSSYNAGNTRRQSTWKLNALDSGQDVIPHHLRASTGSSHNFCKNCRKHSSEAKPWHPLSKRRNKLPADEQSPARNLVGEAKKGTLVKQKLSTPPGSVLGEKKKVTGVEQNPSTSPGSMLGEVKKRTVVMQKTSTTSRSNQSDAKKENLVKQKISTPTVNMLEEGKKDQNKMQRDGTNKLNLEMVPEKTLRTPKVKESPKSSSHLQSRPLSNEEDKKKVVKSADSALGKYTCRRKMLLHIEEAETIGKNQNKTLRKGNTGCSNDNNSSAVKLKFRMGGIVDLQQKTSSPRRLTFRWGRHMGKSQDNNIRKRIFKKKGVDGDKSNTIPISGKIILRHQDVQEKKDVQGLLNNMIEETTSKLVEIGKSKVKSLVGAFEIVIFLHNKPSAVTVS
ncbi:hypothetical protein CQW23_04755 [Capsicum baccatum]|uniref:Calmodulin-binding domain-containing protein n=1 Tax=Capsicum baccatum TaxID=33114 RepID=A0A2G2XFN0_CAPBA|nr:hypothetical protein CQW23_04755 [Capsicum baccatum]